MKGKVHIGTSGWHYKHWVGTFYPEATPPSKQFAYYSKIFHSVELNNPFYRLPARKTFDKWKHDSPKDFLFAVKANRYITHMKKLSDVEESLNTFLQHAAGLGKKLGPILFQLPPGWRINVERLAEFVNLLPDDQRYAFEFRNQSWYDPEIYEILRRSNCAFCIYELAGHRSPIEVTADFVYIRLHGPGDKYQGSYSTRTLNTWGSRIADWLKEGKDTFIYFDNDQLGYAAFNAKKLLDLFRA
ncbi:MAG: DUF72 domain-containing protein [Cyclobacteriaceae bacterium]|jgi:uncharacterized protein YecE (DUF72 family)|nr:DUF72 domain-containing protein [Cyclobacteriaceae bacterium]